MWNRAVSRQAMGGTRFDIVTLPRSDFNANDAKLVHILSSARLAESSVGESVSDKSGSGSRVASCVFAAFDEENEEKVAGAEAVELEDDDDSLTGFNVQGYIT